MPGRSAIFPAPRRLASEGVLTAPATAFRSTRWGDNRAFFRDYGDLVVTITNVFASADGRRVALEWLWEVSRRQ